MAKIRDVRTEVVARAPFIHPDAPDSENDGASAEFHIGTVVTLEPGYVNARRKASIVELPKMPTYQRSRRKAWTRALRIRTPAIVICKCGCPMLLQVSRGDRKLAAATEEERELMAFRAFERSDEQEHWSPLWQIIQDEGLTIAEAIRELMRRRRRTDRSSGE